MSSTQLVIATFNRHKGEEIRSILAARIDVQLLFLSDFGEIMEAPETGVDFDSIGKQKAAFYFDALGVPVLAEDSGLVIPSLDGYPGIHSARVAPDDASRIATVLFMIRSRGLLEPAAYYVCSMTLHDGSGPVSVEGRCSGRVINEPRGTKGFGYDPIFVPEGQARTFAEMDQLEKSSLSHRGRALQRMIPLIASRFQI